MNHKNHIRNIALGTIGLLLIPFTASFFTTDVNWGALDYVSMGGLIFITGFGYEVISRRVHTNAQRIVTGFILAFTLFSVWVELATGGVSRTLGF